MSRKHTIEDAKELAKSKNGKCLSIKYLNNKQKLLWECENGHKWSASFNVIKLKHWCPFCAGVNKLSLEYAKELAKSKNGECLSSEYINSRNKLLWQCEFGHKWETRINLIKKGHWCPFCSGKYNNSIDVCKKIALNKEGKCLSDVYKNGSSKIEWECKFGHRWFSSLQCVKSEKWCPHCAGNAKHNLEDCVELAKNYNGKCLAEKYNNSITKMLWECENGHKWSASFNYIKQGQWCPECSCNKNQKILNRMIKNILNLKTIMNFRGFDWLKDKAKLEIDIWVPDLKLAIEYDGIQHFKAVKHFGGDKKLKYTKRMDRLKNRLIKKHKEEIRYFIRFSYKEEITKEYVYKKLIEKGIMKCLLEKV